MTDWSAFNKDEWSGCAECPSLKQKFVPPELREGAKLLCLGERPGATERDTGRPFSGAAGRMYDLLLKKGGTHRQLVSTANVCMCYHPENETPTVKELACCAEVVEKVIEDSGAEVLLAMGGSAMLRLTGRGEVTKWRGGREVTPGVVELGETTVLGPDCFGPTAQKAGQLKPHKQKLEVKQKAGRVVVSTLHPMELRYSGFTKMPLAMSDFWKARKLSQGKPLIEVGRTLLTHMQPHVMAQVFEKRKDIVLDVETEGAYGKLTIVGVAADHETGFTFAPTQEVLGVLRKALAEPGRVLVGHNLSYDVKVLEANGVAVGCKLWDTMHAAHLDRPDLGGGEAVSDQEDAKKKKGVKFRARALEMVASRLGEYDYFNWKEQFRSKEQPDGHVYCALDNCWTAALRDGIGERLRRKNQLGYFEDVMMPALPVTIRMEQEGVRIDRKLLEELHWRQESYGLALRASLEQLMPGVNVDSDKKLASYFYGELKLAKVMRKRKSGFETPSLDAEALELLEQRNPGLPQLRMLADLRHVEDILVHYCEVKLDAQDRAYYQINLSGTFTGRLSSGGEDGFNIQNLPRSGKGCKRKLEGCVCGEIRRLFVADSDGELFAVADSSQLEYRLVAELAGEEWLRKAFKDRKFDIHRHTAETLGIDRDIAKNVNFAGINLVGAVKLARTAKCKVQVAEEFIRKMRRRIPRVVQYQFGLFDKVKRDEWIETPFHRRGWFHVGAQGEVDQNKVAAFPHQSCGGSMITRSLKRLSDAGLKLRLTVHDENGISARNEGEVKVLQEIMEAGHAELGGWGCYAAVGSGRNWAEAKSKT